MLVTPRSKKSLVIFSKTSILQKKKENFGKTWVVDAGYL